MPDCIYLCENVRISKSGKPSHTVCLCPDPQLVTSVFYFQTSDPLHDKQVMTIEGGPCKTGDLTWPFGSSVAVDRLPNFRAAPNVPRDQPQPHHQCSIHLNCEDTLALHQAFEDAKDGLPSQR